ncbi:hypothetical protein CF319_g8661 [Tilletia indica]|nr:hypothetical protein CF319_g8661 [Tilletia indica]
MLSYLPQYAFRKRPPSPSSSPPRPTSAPSASKLPAALAPTEQDISLLLAAQTHISTKNAEKGMGSYIYKRRADGINFLDLVKTCRSSSLPPVSSPPLRTPPTSVSSPVVPTDTVPSSSSPPTPALRPSLAASPPVPSLTRALALSRSPV